MKSATRYSQTIILGLLGMFFLVGLYVLGAETGWRLDTTEDKRFSLSDQSAVILERIRTPVKAVAFFLPQEPGRERIKDLMGLFARKCKSFSYEFVDPDRDPFRARELKIARTGEVVLLSGEKAERIARPDEESLVNGIIRVTDPDKTKIYLVQGHGEMSPESGRKTGVSRFKENLEKEGSVVEPMFLAEWEEVPSDADAVLILGPRTDMLKHELDALTRWFTQGGRILYAIDAETRTNMDDWMAANTDTKRLDGLILDPVSRLITGNYLSPVAQKYRFEPITKDFRLLTIYPTCAGIEPARGVSPGAELKYIAQSTPESWLETDLTRLEEGKAKFDSKTDRSGPMWMSAAYEKKTREAGLDSSGNATKSAPGRRFVVFGDQDFLSDAYVGMAGNLDLAKNAVNWLLDRENLISVVKPKAIQALLLPRPGQSFFLIWMPLAVVPGLVLVVALVVARRRRRSK